MNQTGFPWMPARDRGQQRLKSDCAGRVKLTLPAQRRLRRKVDFDAAYARGRRFGDGFFGVTAFLNDKGGPRLGLAVAVRTAGGGVERNRLRRVIRESFRFHQHELPSVDLIVSARSRARDAASAELRASLEGLWKKVTEQCASLSRS
jgi:ribonuclease P protein component